MKPGDLLVCTVPLYAMGWDYPEGHGIVNSGRNMTIFPGDTMIALELHKERINVLTSDARTFWVHMNWVKRVD